MLFYKKTVNYHNKINWRLLDMKKTTLILAGVFLSILLGLSAYGT